MNALNIFDISNNLGDTKSLVTHPATTTHRIIGFEVRKKLKITDSMIRLSIGLEDIDDLIEDIDNALKKI
jgi:O-succinylhomoserine sulfhydrylase